MRNLTIILLVLFSAACTSQKSGEAGTAQAESATAEPEAGAESQRSTTPASATPDGDFAEPKFGTPVHPGSDNYDMDYKKALFAGGCFWCMEPPFDKLDGVVATVSGYAGGTETKPEYKEVARGMTSHTEAVLVVYDPSKVTYDELLDAFWRSHDPTDGSGQFVDRGRQYRPAVFYYNDSQKEAAQASAKKLDESGRLGKPIATEITEATDFWPAEEYHQDFYVKDSSHYKRYRSGSGRDQYIKRVWGD